MLKFFRKIRQRLLSENKFTKYLIYAVGEILLVVIGILIALQINNWNEQNKLNVEEIKMLQNFQTTIAGDLAEVSRYDRHFDGTDRSIQRLIIHLQGNRPYHDSLNWHFTNSTSLWSPKIDQEVFQTLASTDLNIISNDSLKKELISYYSFAKRTFDVRMNRYANIMEDAGKNVFNTRFNAIWNDTWEDPHLEEDQKGMIPRDYAALLKDEDYLYFLRSLKNQLYWYVRSPLKEAKTRAEKLLTSLDNELHELEK